jgi:nitrogen fixation protein FixH
MKKILFFSVFLVALNFFSSAKPVYRLVNPDPEEKITIPNNHIDYFHDTSGEITPLDLIRRLPKPMSSPPPATIPHEEYWMDVTVQINSDETWYIEFPDPHISSLEIWMVKHGKAVKFDSTGTGTSFESKNYPYKNFIVPIASDKRAHRFLIRVQSRLISNMQMQITSDKELFGYAQSEYYLLGLFYGILLMMGVYNLILFFSFRERTYLYYVGYVIASALFSFNEDGMGFQFLWPSFPWINLVLPYISFPLLVTFCLYAQTFIDLKKNSPGTYRMVWIMIGSHLSHCLFILFDWVSIHSWPLTFLPPYVLLLRQSILAYKSGFKAARLYLVGVSVVLVSIIIYGLRINGFIVSGWFTVYSFNIAIVGEAIVLSFALGDKIKFTREAKERAQANLIQELERNERLKDKVNRELEQKVSERTTELKQRSEELEQANEELEALKEQLYEMNAQLDKDNWTLQKKIHDSTRHRIVSKEVGFEEFVKIYPDNLNCQKHLEDVKWGEGFSCPKCKNTTYSPGQKPFTRKCSKCKHPDSVTAGTIFHALKFPLNKAFYICYIVAEGSNYTVDELSKILDLRRNTCWSFRKKAETRKEELLKNGTIKKGANWESLVVN